MEELRRVHLPRREALGVGIAQDGPQLVQIVAEPVGPDVAAQQRPGPLDLGGDPGHGNVRRGRVVERRDRHVLGRAKRLVEARREPGVRFGEALPHRDEVHDRVEPGLPVPGLLGRAVVGEEPPHRAVAAAEAGRRPRADQSGQIAGLQHRRQAAPRRQRPDLDLRRQVERERAVASRLLQPAGAPEDVGRHHAVLLGQHPAHPERGGHRVDRHADLPPLQVGGVLDPGIGADVDRRVAEHPRGEDGEADIGDLAARPGEHEGGQRHLGHVELGIGEGAVGGLLDRDREVGDLAALDGDAAVDYRAHAVVIARRDRYRKLSPHFSPRSWPARRRPVDRAGEAHSAMQGTSGKRLDAPCRPDGVALRVAPSARPRRRGPRPVPATPFGPLLARPGHDAGRDPGEKCGRPCGRSEADPVAALEVEPGARLLRGRDLERKLLDDAADLGDLLGVRFGELAARQIEAVLEADADVAAHHRAHRAEAHLVPPGAQDRPLVVVAEQAVGGLLHEDQVLLVGADAAEDAEDGLHEERRADQPPVEEVGEVVEMADIVALELETGAVRLSQILQDAFYILESISEYEVVRAAQIGLLPVVFPLLDAVGGLEDAEIDRAHVERGDLGLGDQRRRHAFLHRHAEPAAGGDVDHRVGVLLDPGQELHEHRGVRRRPAVVRVAGVEVEDRGARLRRPDRLLGHLVRGERQVVRHRGGVDRAGNRAGDDDLVVLRHVDRSYSSKMATARVQPADAPLILTGKQETVNPVAGSSSRLPSFSIWQ